MLIGLFHYQDIVEASQEGKETLENISSFVAFLLERDH